MPTKLCCVDSCLSKNMLMYAFPRDEDLQYLWLLHVKPHSSELLGLSPFQLRSKKVCIVHFESKYLEHCHRKYHGFPTLFTDEEIATGIPNRQFATVHSGDHSYCKIRQQHEEDIDSSIVKKPKYNDDHIQKELEPKSATRKDDRVNSSTSLGPTTVKISNSNQINEDNGNEDQIENYEATVDNDLYTMDDFVDDLDDAITICLGDNKIKYDEDVEFVDELRLEKDPEILNHFHFKCNACRGKIIGFRYVCVECSDWDMCTSCEARGEHPEHYVLRLPAPRPYEECQAVIAAIRQQIENLLLLSKEFKSEIILKEETNLDEMQEIEDNFTPAEDPLHAEKFSATNDRKVLKAANEKTTDKDWTQLTSIPVLTESPSLAPEVREVLEQLALLGIQTPCILDLRPPSARRKSVKQYTNITYNAHSTIKYTSAHRK